MSKTSASPPAYDWRRRIQSCVTVDKMIFAGSETEKANAFSLLTYFRKKEMPWSEIKTGFKHYFAARTNDKSAVREQMTVVKSYFRCWL